MASEQAANGRTRLNSWKEIAGYLDRDVRTVLRWHKERGLPVHRVPGGQGRSVFAYADELDAWIEGTPAAEERWPATRVPGGRTAVLVALVAVVAIAVGVPLASRLRIGSAVRVEVRDAAIVGLDAAERETWRVALPRGATLAHAQHGPLFVDLDADGSKEIVAAVALEPAAPSSDGSSTPVGSLDSMPLRMERASWPPASATRATQAC